MEKKSKGRANSENKYEFARPIDEKLFFGNILVLMKCTKSNEYHDLNTEMWEKINEILHGGFEDIGDSDDERSVDTDVYDEDEYTAEGYVKDDFVVDDDELIEEEYNNNEESDAEMSYDEDESDTSGSFD